MGEYSIGVDLGGTNLRAAAIGADGKMIEKNSGTTDLHEGATRLSPTWLMRSTFKGRSAARKSWRAWVSASRDLS